MASSNVLLSGDGSGGLMPDWSHDRREDRLQAGRSESVVAESGFTMRGLSESWDWGAGWDVIRKIKNNL